MNQLSIGDTVRITVGPKRGCRGEITGIDGGVYTVRHAGGSTTFRARELEAI